MVQHRHSPTAIPSEAASINQDEALLLFSGSLGDSLHSHIPVSMDDAVGPWGVAERGLIDQQCVLYEVDPLIWMSHRRRT